MRRSQGFPADLRIGKAQFGFYRFAPFLRILTNRIRLLHWKESRTEHQWIDLHKGPSWLYDGKGYLCPLSIAKECSKITMIMYYQKANFLMD